MSIYCRQKVENKLSNVCDKLMIYEVTPGGKIIKHVLQSFRGKITCSNWPWRASFCNLTLSQTRSMKFYSITNPNDNAPSVVLDIICYFRVHYFYIDLFMIITEYFHSWYFCISQAALLKLMCRFSWAILIEKVCQKWHTFYIVVC